MVKARVRVMTDRLQRLSRQTGHGNARRKADTRALSEDPCSSKKGIPVVTAARRTGAKKYVSSRGEKGGLTAKCTPTFPGHA